MPKGTKVTEGLFHTVKQLQEINRDSSAEEIGKMVCKEATVIRQMLKCQDWAEYCERKKAKAAAQKERERVKKQAEPQKDEEQVPGQIRMDLTPAEEHDETLGEMQVRMMRFQAAQVDKLILKIDKLNDTMSMILRAVRRE